MGEEQLSVGDDTPTGEPENGSDRSYITEKEDGTPKSTGSKEDSDQRREPNGQLPSRTEREIAKKSELGSDR